MLKPAVWQSNMANVLAPKCIGRDPNIAIERLQRFGGRQLTGTGNPGCAWDSSQVPEPVILPIRLWPCGCGYEVVVVLGNSSHLKLACDL